MSRLDNEVDREDQAVAWINNHLGLRRYIQKSLDRFQASSQSLGQHQSEILFLSKNTYGHRLVDFFRKWLHQNPWTGDESHLLVRQFLRQ